MLQGYTLTGRTGVFPSYEAFLGIVHTMMVQYAKFAKVANESWRKDFSWGSLNYIETSTWTRQEHNGFSHQNPGFIGAVLALKPKFARVYFPPDANCFLSTVAHCLRAKKYINLMVGSKQPTPVWLTPEEANAVSSSPTWQAFADLLLSSIASPVRRYGSLLALIMVSILMCESFSFSLYLCGL